MSNYIELRNKAEQLLREAEIARKEEVALVIVDIKAKMSAYGIGFEDLGGLTRRARGRKPKSAKPARGTKSVKSAKAAKPKTRSGTVRKPVAAKYRNEATGETWTGRGKLPKWLMALETAGRKREEFSVSES